MRGWLQTRGLLDNAPPIVALLSILVLDSFVSSGLSVWQLNPATQEILASGERLAGIVRLGLFLIGVGAWLLGRTRILRWAVMLTNGFVMVGLIGSVLLLAATIGERGREVEGLASDALIVFVTNVFVFAIWYWLLDSHRPAAAGKPVRTDFLFPQRASDLPAWSDWRPGFVDYLFVAFTACTAFSPTDTAVLSRRAKLLMMCQASMSIIIVVALVARAINLVS
jgi:hypothetical protein